MSNCVFVRTVDFRCNQANEADARFRKCVLMCRRVCASLCILDSKMKIVKLLSFKIFSRFVFKCRIFTSQYFVIHNCIQISPSEFLGMFEQEET